MKHTTFTLQVVLGILTATALLAATGEPGFEMTRSTIDGGGVIQGSGGGFELSGTVGQPDAGVMTGGEFNLSGGLWFELPPTDCNDESLVTTTASARTTSARALSRFCSTIGRITYLMTEYSVPSAGMTHQPTSGTRRNKHGTLNPRPRPEWADC